jgi:hypothetical protein
MDGMGGWLAGFGVQTIKTIERKLHRYKLQGAIHEHSDNTLPWSYSS